MGLEQCTTKECVRCNDEYEPYEVLMRDNIVELMEHLETEKEWNLHQNGNDGFCKPCRMAVTNYGSYLTEPEREKIEPKIEV